MIAQVGEDRGSNRHLTGCAYENGVSIGRLSGDKFGGNPAPRPHAVFNHGRNAGSFLKLLHHEASEQVIAATGRETNNEMDRLVRIARLRPRIFRICEKHQQCAQYAAANPGHAFLSPFARIPSPAAIANAYTGDAGGKTLWP